jgi:hydroxylamine reductase (hybrid-cluster protein)
MSYAGWMRNYHAMGDPKLRQALDELEGQYGDAFQRVNSKGGLLYEHVQEARREAKSRGWDVKGATGSNAAPVSASTVGVLTEAMECAECGRNERHYEDDYICRVCRDALATPESVDEEVVDETAYQAMAEEAAIDSKSLLRERLMEKLEAHDNE